MQPVDRIFKISANILERYKLNVQIIRYIDSNTV